jgi:hypothetical protein
VDLEALRHVHAARPLRQRVGARQQRARRRVPLLAHDRQRPQQAGHVLEAELVHALARRRRHDADELGGIGVGRAVADDRQRPGGPAQVVRQQRLAAAGARPPAHVLHPRGAKAVVPEADGGQRPDGIAELLRAHALQAQGQRRRHPGVQEGEVRVDELREAAVVQVLAAAVEAREGPQNVGQLLRREVLHAARRGHDAQPGAQEGAHRRAARLEQRERVDGAGQADGAKRQDLLFAHCAEFVQEGLHRRRRRAAAQVRQELGQPPHRVGQLLRRKAAQAARRRLQPPGDKVAHGVAQTRAAVLADL